MKRSRFLMTVRTPWCADFGEEQPEKIGNFIPQLQEIQSKAASLIQSRGYAFSA